MLQASKHDGNEYQDFGDVHGRKSAISVRGGWLEGFLSTSMDKSIDISMSYEFRKMYCLCVVVGLCL